MGLSLHRGSIGEPGGGLVTRDFEIWTKEGSGHTASLSLSPSIGALRGEHGGMDPLLETLKDMLREALEMGIFLHWGPIGEPGEGVRLPGTLRR